jgi:hypothetical protein
MHQQAGVVPLVLGIGVAVAVIAIALFVGLRMRGRLFAGAARDQWDEGRSALSSREQRQVQWATMRRRPVPAAALAPAQRAYISYAQYTIGRSPWTTSRRFRTAFQVLYGLLAVNSVIEGTQHSQGRIFHLVLAACFAALAVVWVPLTARSLRRLPARLERLRTQINDRYGPASATP